MKLCKRTFKIESWLEKYHSSKICKTLAAFPKVRGRKPLNHVNLGLVSSLGMCCGELHMRMHSQTGTSEEF